MESKPEADLTSTLHLGGRQGITPADLSELAMLSEEERGIVAKLSPKDGMLIVHRGPGKGSRYLLTNSSTIGRSSDSDVFLDDVTVSRKHALVSFSKQGAFNVKDLGSLNGTYINGKPIVDAVMSSGDEVQIGKFHMLFFGGKS